jgi:hypothetical protein
MMPSHQGVGLNHEIAADPEAAGPEPGRDSAWTAPAVARQYDQNQYHRAGRTNDPYPVVPRVDRHKLSSLDEAAIPQPGADHYNGF